MNIINSKGGHMETFDLDVWPKCLFLRVSIDNNKLKILILKRIAHVQLISGCLQKSKPFQDIVLDEEI